MPNRQKKGAYAPFFYLPYFWIDQKLYRRLAVTLRVSP
jgi:hypothetical protein